jgi:hypothetical protein
MKKLLLLVALLTISLTLTFAQDVTAKIVGEAGTKWEMDLDYESSGFTTWAKASIEIDASTGGRELTSEEDIYGYVKVSNLDLGQFRMGWYESADGWAQAWGAGGSFILWGGSDPLDRIEMAQTLSTNGRGSEPINPSIEAKIVMGPAYAKFDGNTYIRAERFFDDRTMQFKEDVLDLEVNKLWTDLGNGSGIVELGYDQGGIKIAAKISSASYATPQDSDYSGDLSPAEIAAANIDDTYSAGVDIGIGAVENLDVSLGVYTSFSGMEDYVSPIHAGLKVKYSLAISEDITIEPYAGGEVIISGVEDADPSMEIAGGVNIKWPGTAWDYAWGMGDSIIDYWMGWPEHFIAFSGANLYVNYLSLDAAPADPINSLNVRATLFDDFGDGGLIPMLGVGLIGIMNMSLMEDVNPEIGIGAFLNAAVAEGIAPFVALDVLMDNEQSIAGNNVQLSIGAEITAIPNAIITLAYDGQGRNIAAENTDPGSGALGVIRAQFRFKYY